jgi:hypothetical protein
MTATYNQAKDAPHGIADILVDDTLMAGNMQFAKAEELMHRNYNMGQTQTITNGSQMKFGGVRTGRDPDGTLSKSQQAYICSAARTNVVLRIVMSTITVV